MLCRRKCIVGRLYDHDFFLFCLFNDLVGHRGILTDNHTARVHIDGTLLCILAVAHNNKVIFIDEIRHQNPARRRDHDFSFQKITVLISGEHFPVHRPRDIAVLGARLGEDRAVVHFHVCFCDIANSNNSLQLSVSCHRKGMYI